MGLAYSGLGWTLFFAWVSRFAFVGQLVPGENIKVEFLPYFINHNLFIEPDVPSDFDSLYSGINTNSGNGLIATSLAKILGVRTYTGGIKNIFVCRAEDVNFETINKNHSHAFLILEDHIGEQWNHLPWARMQGVLEALDLPLIVFSLGCCGVNKTPDAVVSEICTEAKNFLGYLARRAVTIGVRGSFTGQVLDRLGIRNYQVVGCPTYFERGPHRVVAQPDVTTASKVVGTGLFTSNTIEHVHYVLQSEVELLRALIDISPITQQDASSLMAVPWPDYASKYLDALTHDRVSFFTSPEEWGDCFDGSVALTVGTRVHGSIVSLNKGCPSIVTAGDVRAEEMCRLFQIPHFPGAYLADATPAELAEMADPTALNTAYPELYENFRSWLVDTCCLPLPEEPLALIDWKIYRVRLLPGPVAAERFRGAYAASEVSRLSRSLGIAEDQQKEISATVESLSAQQEDLLAQCADIEHRLAELTKTQVGD